MLETGKFTVHENIKNYFSFYDFEKLIKKLINEYMLLKKLREWIIGLPGSSVDFIVDSHGYLKNINSQYNEKIFVLSYKKYYDNIVPFLPKTIEIYYDKKICLNIKIHKWII